MEYTRVSRDNIEQENICCVLANNDDTQVASKKKWMSENFDEGLKFIKTVVPGKCFIEFMPAENAWAPIIAKDYMYINCFSVHGKLKHYGLSVELLKLCIDESMAQLKRGLCILTASSPTGFLPQQKFIKYKDFELCDETDTGIQLWYLPFYHQGEKPHFKECAKHPEINEKGFVLYYSDQCPFMAKYVPILQETATRNSIPLKTIHIIDKETAQNAPTPITNFSLFYNGKYIPRVVLSEKKFLEVASSFKDL